MDFSQSLSARGIPVWISSATTFLSKIVLDCLLLLHFWSEQERSLRFKLSFWITLRQYIVASSFIANVVLRPDAAELLLWREWMKWLISFFMLQLLLLAQEVGLVLRLGKEVWFVVFILALQLDHVQADWPIDLLVFLAANNLMLWFLEEGVVTETTEAHQERKRRPNDHSYNKPFW